MVKLHEEKIGTKLHNMDLGKDFFFFVFDPKAQGQKQK
jgi:hypothetical protein